VSQENPPRKNIQSTEYVRSLPRCTRLDVDGTADATVVGTGFSFKLLYPSGLDRGTAVGRLAGFCA
jgi:hypothetical protein